MILRLEKVFKTAVMRNIYQNNLRLDFHCLETPWKYWINKVPLQLPNRPAPLPTPIHQQTKQWISRITNEEKATYAGRISSMSSGLPRSVSQFVEKLRGALLKIVMDKGGTEFSILRHTFLDWDGDRSGELALDEFRNAMSTLGVRGSDEVRKGATLERY